MKTKRFFALCFGVAAAVTACKEKEVDSPDITVLSPKVNEVIADKDSVRIKFVLRPKGASVTSYSATVKTKNDKMIFHEQRGCDCKSKDQIEASTAFRYDIDKTSDVSLEIKAILDDGRELVERVPFVLKE